MSKILQLKETTKHRNECKKRLRQIINLVDDENLTSVIVVATGPGKTGGITAKNISEGDHYKLIGLMFEQQKIVTDLADSELIDDDD